MKVKNILPMFVLGCFLIVLVSSFYVREGFYLPKDQNDSPTYLANLKSAVSFAMTDTTKKSFILVMPENTGNISGIDQKLSGLLNPNQRLLTILGDSDTLKLFKDGVLNLTPPDLPVMLVIKPTGPVIYRDKNMMDVMLSNLTI